MEKKKRFIIVSIVLLSLLIAFGALILSLYLVWPKERSATDVQGDVSSSYPPNPIEAIEKKICKDIENFWQCSQLLEVRTLSLSDKIKRKDKKLIVRFDDKKEMVFEDGEYEGKKIDVSYSLHGFAEKQGIYIINAMYYEGNIFILLDYKSKSRVNVDALPYFSPNGEVFAICNADESSYTPGIFEIYRRSFHFANEYRQDEACRALRWIDDQKIEVVLTDYQKDWRVTLCEKNHSWVACP